MRNRLNFCKADFLVSLFCLGFMAVCLGAIGGGGRTDAKKQLCLSNLRQWANLFGMYCSDNNGYFQSYFRSNPDWQKLGTWTWPVVMKPYYKGNENICYCPTATQPQYDKNGHSTGAKQPFVAFGPATWYGYTGETGSYCENLWKTNPEYDPGGTFAASKFWRSPGVTGGNKVPIFGCASTFYGFPSSTDAPPDFSGQFPAQGTFNNILSYWCVDRHGNGTMNMLFLDGSVRPVGLKELWTLKWSKSNSWPVNPHPVWPAWMSNFKNY